MTVGSGNPVDVNQMADEIVDQVNPRPKFSSFGANFSFRICQSKEDRR